MNSKSTIEEKKLGKSSRQLLSYLRAAANDAGLVEMSLLELSADLGLCRQTIIAATASLESLEIVTVTRGRRTKAKGGRVSAGKNIYRLSQSAVNREV
ncbi:hypothetical protein ACK85N_004758 [Salmonella enterica]|nr:hypothetical protein [Salmonella enterica]MLT78527.1 hypothetical protein [Salmonella enterica subsp. enterica serovar Sandiego]EBI9418502.1 hypothetical protein [Salmonella enterica]EBT7965303.1 hypothetical protein [Salmonella enterica]ECP4146879.1 hypothetical protein [Salmonella enterica]